MSQPLLVETVSGRSMAELLAAREATRDADLVELRLDGIGDLDVAAALHGRKRPAIVTCRPLWEGGRFDGAEEERRRILGQSLRLGSEFVDVEWRAGFTDLVKNAGGARVLLSSHDFGGVPKDVLERTRAMRATGAEIIKIAVTARRLTDTLPLRDVTREGPAVVIAMGDAGVATRLLAAQFGSCWTYGGAGAAPGQLPVARMLDEYRFRHIGGATKVYALVGKAVLQSRSPAMHNAAFAGAGLDAVYVPLQATDFGDFLAFADALGIAGASVTIPFKLDALGAAVAADDAARQVGAANTLRRHADGWEATNTDVFGFLAPLGSAPSEAGASVAVYDLRGKRVSVLGAGGAARAVVVALASRGARITVHARRAEQAQQVAALVGAAAGKWPPEPGSWDVLVNCTPLGGVLHPNDSPLPRGPFDGELVYDLISRPPETRLMREARASGCRVLGGMPMLVAQAERQFEWWTGQRPPAGLMAHAAEDRGQTAVANHINGLTRPVYRV